MIPSLSICALLFAGPALPMEDWIHLRDGKVLRGTISVRKPKFVLVSVGGRSRRIARSKIAKITDEKGHIRWVDAYPIETAHYRVRTNIDRPRADEMLARLERFYAWFQATFRKELKPHAVKRMGVDMFRTRREYSRAWHAETGEPADPPTGFYYAATETLYIVDARPRAVDLAKNALFHEGGHQLLQLACSLAPVRPGLPHHWINEALPCFFEAVDPAQGKTAVGIAPHRVLRTCDLLRRGRQHALDAFDALRRKQYQIDEYCQGYTLAYFFMTARKGRYRRAFLRYCRDVWLTRVRPETFAKHFGKPIAAFEDEWKAYTLGLEGRARAMLRADRAKAGR